MQQQKLRRSGSPPEYFLQFSLRNACITFYDDHWTRFRASIVSQEDNIEGIVHGFSEYNNGYQRLTSIKPAIATDIAMDQCARRAVGIGIPFSCNNVYHQSFHAVPAFEAWGGISAAAASKGQAVDLIPLIYPSAAVSKKMSSDPRRWHAWEFSLRAFTSQTSAEIAANTDRLLRAPCTCYQWLHGNAEAFNPIARRSARRMLAFRAAVLRQIGPIQSLAIPAPLLNHVTSSSTAMLWCARRHALRNIENEAELALAFEHEPALAPRIRRVILETMPLAAQMRLIHRSAALIAVHGQAMT